MINSSFNSTRTNASETTENSVLIQGPWCLVAVVSVLYAFELCVFVFITKLSWTAYSTATRSKPTYWKFIKTLSPLKKCFLVANIFILADSSMFIVRLSVPTVYNDYRCTVIHRITGPGSYTMALTSTYIYLWARQYFLHSSPVLKSVLPKWLPVFSKFSLIATIVAGGGQISCMWFGPAALKDHLVNGNCRHIASSTQFFQLLLLCGTFFLQSLYLILFFATLKIHRKANKMAINKKDQEFGDLIKRCTILAGIGIFTDIIGTIYLANLAGKVPEVYIHLYPKFNMMINLICMLVCFNNFGTVAKSFLEFITCGKYAEKVDKTVLHSKRTITDNEAKSKMLEEVEEKKDEDNEESAV